VRHSILLAVYVHPLDELLKWLPEVDSAVLERRFVVQGWDYSVLIKDCLGSNQGQQEIAFTHCVRAEYQTGVRDQVWPNSWSDEFTDYEQ